MRDFLVLLISFPGLIASLIRPEWGVVFYMFLAFSRVQDFAFGFVRYQSWSMWAAVATFISLAHTGKWVPYRDSAIARICLAILAWVTLTCWTGIQPAFSWSTFTSQYCKVLLMFFVACRVIDRPSRLDLLIIVVTGAFCFHGLKFGVYGGLKGFAHNLVGPGGQMGDNNSFGMVMSTMFPMVLYLAGNARKELVKVGMKAVILPYLIAIICTYSRGAFVNLSLGFIITILLSKYKVRSFILVPILIVAVLPFIPQAFIDRMATIGATGEDLHQTSTGDRLALLGYGILLFQKHIWFGAGHGAYMKAAYQDLGPGHGEFTEHLPHNAYVLLGVEAGVIGVLLYIGLFIAVWLALLRIYRDPFVKSRLPVYHALTKALLASTMGYFANSIFNNYPYHEMGYFLVLVTACLSQIVTRARAGASEQPAGRKKSRTGSIPGAKNGSTVN